MSHLLFTDGGARGNPGPAAIGAVLIDSKNKTVFKISKFIGVSTNNVAEYEALLEGLTKSLKENAKEIKCFLDSELVVKQLNGLYKVKNPKMKEYFTKIKDLEKKFQKVSYEHVKRDFNSVADSLVNKALDNINA